MAWKLFEVIGGWFRREERKFGPHDEELVEFILFVFKEDPDGWDYVKLTESEGLLTYVAGNYAIHIKDGKVYLKNDLSSHSFFKVLKKKEHHDTILTAAHGMVNAYALNKIREIGTRPKGRCEMLVDELTDFIRIALPNQSQVRANSVDVVIKVIGDLQMRAESAEKENVHMRRQVDLLEDEIENKVV